MKIFPDYYTDKVCSEIQKHGRDEEILVYRVGKYGKNDTTAFLNYYDEVMLGLKTVRNKEQFLEKCKNSIDQLSVSCYEDMNDILDYYKITLKDTHPKRILLRGVTMRECGMCGRTRERKEKCTDSHVDWWLYRDTAPYKYFEEVVV